jgi:3-hydroxymyristoyl/3-hydroxydecanoyl-(acyl carrier protein) dehydratase
MYEYPMHLDIEAIERFIPHRAPMLFASKVSVLTHDHYTGEASWAADSFVFDGHFPGHPIVPGVMIVEAGAQIAGVGLRAGDPIAGSKARGNVGLLMAIRKCFFKRPVSPGLTLHYELRTRRIAENIVNITGDVNCAYGPVATLEFVFSQAPLTQIEHLLSDSSTREI